MGISKERIFPKIVEILKNGDVIATGCWNGGKRYTKDYPSQTVYLYNLKTFAEYDSKYSKTGSMQGEILFVHSDENGISFKEYADDGRIIYDSLERKEYEYFTIEEERPCGECENNTPISELQWTNDRYGIPFKKVCPFCHDKVSKRIKSWVFDETYAGERL